MTQENVFAGALDPYCSLANFEMQSGFRLSGSSALALCEICLSQGGCNTSALSGPVPLQNLSIKKLFGVQGLRLDYNETPNIL